MATENLNIFLPIHKVDAAKRLVYGTVAEEIADRSGEIMDYATAKPAFEAWSANIHKSSNGKSLGNLRAMHGKVAAGKMETINFDDTAKRIEAVAKVVDDVEWQKVVEGVYTGFSMGGKYTKRWKDEADPTLTRYTPEPFEVSLVDLPCIPTATFEYVKSDGSTELRKFHSVVENIATAPAIENNVSNEEVSKHATELATAAGDPSQWTRYVDVARAALTAPPLALEATKATNPTKPEADMKTADSVVIEKASPIDGDEWEQVWKSKRDNSTFRTKAELRKHHEMLDAKATAQDVAKPALDVLKDISASLDKRDGGTEASPAKSEASDKVAPQEEVAKAQPIVKKADVETQYIVKKVDVEKGLYSVSRLADLIQSLSSLAQQTAAEAISEGDGSAVPASLKDQVSALCETLKSMVEEETAELLSGDGPQPDYAYFAAKIPGDKAEALSKAVVTKHPEFASELEKAGARHSKTDSTTIQAMHDNAVKLGASCDGAMKSAEAPEDDRLNKALADNEALRGVVVDMTKGMGDVLARLKKLEDQPMPMPGSARVVGKEDDRPNTSGKALTIESLAEVIGADEMAKLAIKLAQRNPQTIFAR